VNISKKKFENKIKNLINEKESNFENELVTLKVMGFLNEELNLQLLSKYSKLEKVVAKLLKLNQ